MKQKKWQNTASQKNKQTITEYLYYRRPEEEQKRNSSSINAINLSIQRQINNQTSREEDCEFFSNVPK